MNYRYFGNKGFKISEIVFGAGAVGGLIIKKNHETRLEAFSEALNLGINWIDTAPAYGDGLSEQHLGELLPNFSDHEIRVSSKIQIRHEHLADIKGEIEKSLESSLKRLNVEAIDLIQLHTPVTEVRGDFKGSASHDSLGISDVLDKDGVLEALSELKNSGMAKLIGFTGFGDTDALKLMVKTGAFDAIQVYYNVLNPSAGTIVPNNFTAHNYKELINDCHEFGMGILNIRALAAGAVAGNSIGGTPAALSPGSTSNADEIRADILRKVLNIDTSQAVNLAIQYVLENKKISGVVVGFSEIEHIRQAVSACDKSLSDSQLNKIRNLHSTDFGTLRMP